LIFGTLVIPVSFYLGRHIYNERVGLITAFFVTVHPYLIRYSGDTLREGLYYFLAATVTLLGVKVIFTRSLRLMFLVGLFSFLAYMVKQGAIGFLIIISLWIVFYNIRQIREDWRERLALLASGWVLFILMALPYLLFLHQEIGGMAITGKMPLKILFTRIYTIATFNNTEHWVDFLKHFPEAFSIPFFVLFLFFIFKRFKEGFTSSEVYLISILVGYSVIYLFGVLLY
jgi:4-amino-4-deoxy-L-arabinose transferase-like glycosyltransferase